MQDKRQYTCFFKYLTRSDHNLYLKRMRMQIAIIVLFICCFLGKHAAHLSDRPMFLIFSNDGTFYKLDPGEQHVHWHSNLGQKLISFEISEAENNVQNSAETYFIPTIEGHFIYIQKNKEILVHREEIQPLLKICFGNSNNNKNELALHTEQQYFLHQKYQYFFIDLHNGKLWNIQSYFKDRIVAKQGRHALIKISKKFLKRLKPDFNVKWSAISSTIDIISAVDFLKDPKNSFQTKQALMQSFEFRRVSNNEMQVYDISKQKGFQMGSTSPIMAVFSYIPNEHIFQKYPIIFFKKPILAIQDKHETERQKLKNQMAQIEMDVFPHASQYKNSNKVNQKIIEDQTSGFDFQYCLNTFRAIQQLSSSSGSGAQLISDIPMINRPEIQNDQKKFILGPENNLPPTQQISPTSHPHLFFEPQRSKEQPLIWIFIIGSLIASGILFYRFKVGKLLSELQKLGTYHDKRFQEIQKRLGQFEQMQKMYEVYWDKLLYRTTRRKASDIFEDAVISDKQDNQQSLVKNHEIQIYEHMVFQGRFLNKDALVYAVPMEGIDLIHVQHQLNDLLSCSHKSLVKLYYYTKNTQFLLIFCEKIQPLWESIQKSSFFTKIQNREEENPLKSIENTSMEKLLENGNSQLKVESKPKESTKNKRFQSNQLAKKLGHLVKQIIECVDYLDSKIEIFSLPLQSIISNERFVMTSQKDLDRSFTASQDIQLKINTIPSILQIYKHQQTCQQDRIKHKHNLNMKLRHDLVKIFYFINTKGQKINIKQVQSMISKQQNTDDEQFFVKDFYNFVLNENYSLNIVIQTPEKNDVKQQKVRKFGTNHEFLNSLISHPFLWDSKRKMLFLSDFSNYIETYLDDYKIKKFESYSRDYHIIDTPWTKHLDIAFVKEVNQFRKYDFNSVRDLIRLIRNKVNHFHEIPKQTRNSIGKTPEAFIQYMLKLYPKLLSFAFAYAKKKKWRLHVQIK